MDSWLPNYIEIETSRYCNRRCGWCPNGSHESRRVQELMPWPLLSGILAQLATLRFHGWLAFHNYNEPLANSRLLEELAAAHLALPACSLSIFTNGDLLTPELLTSLESAGLAHLRVTLYPNTRARNGTKEPSSEAITNWLHAKRLIGCLDWHPATARQGAALATSIGDLRVEVIRPDLRKYNWRGGTAPAISGVARTAPCFMTSHSASIDYRGRLKMCCNVFPEATGHEQYVVGNLSDSSFESLWLSESMQSYRMAHARGDWSSSTICAKCSHRLPPDQELAIRARTPSGS